jgi:hypothetical protein
MARAKCSHGWDWFKPCPACLNVQDQVNEIEAEISYHMGKVHALKMLLESTIDNYRWREPTEYVKRRVIE